MFPSSSSNIEHRKQVATFHATIAKGRPRSPLVDSPLKLRRTQSLPAHLDNDTTSGSRSLFWFRPKTSRRRRRMTSKMRPPNPTKHRMNTWRQARKPRHNDPLERKEVQLPTLREAERPIMLGDESSDTELSSVRSDDEDDLDLRGLSLLEERDESSSVSCEPECLSPVFRLELTPQCRHGY